MNVEGTTTERHRDNCPSEFCTDRDKALRPVCQFIGISLWCFCLTLSSCHPRGWGYSSTWRDAWQRPAGPVKWPIVAIAAPSSTKQHQQHRFARLAEATLTSPGKSHRSR